MQDFAIWTRQRSKSVGVSIVDYLHQRPLFPYFGFNIGYFSQFFTKKTQKITMFSKSSALAPFGRVDFGEIKTLLSRARISDNFANSSENIMRNRNSTPQNSKNPHAKWAAKPPFLVPFFRVLGGGIPVSHNIFRGICKIIANSREPYRLGRLVAYWAGGPVRCYFSTSFYKILGKISNINPKIRS